MSKIKKWSSNGNWVEIDLNLCMGSCELFLTILFGEIHK